MEKRSARPAPALAGNAQRLLLRANAGMVRLGIARKISLLHVRTIFFYRAADQFAEVDVLTCELGGVAEGQTQHVVDHQNLSVAIGPGTDTDGGDAQFARDLRG